MSDNNSDFEFETTDETNSDETELEAVETKVTDKIKTLRDKLKACEAEKLDILEQLQRAKADFLNARKRLEEERLRDRERVIEQHIEKLLPLFDSFTMAMQDKVAWAKVDDNWRSGVESIFSQLQKVLASYGVAAIEPLGQTFDPALHEALSEQSVTDPAQDHTILAIVQAGFTRTNATQTTLIRPARVVVGTFTS